MIDVQDTVLRFFAIDHVLVSFVTIATTGTIFSLQFTSDGRFAKNEDDSIRFSKTNFTLFDKFAYFC